MGEKQGKKPKGKVYVPSNGLYKETCHLLFSSVQIFEVTPYHPKMLCLWYIQRREVEKKIDLGRIMELDPVKEHGSNALELTRLTNS